MIVKVEEERDKLASKFEEKRKALKDLERTTSLQISSLEKEKAVLQEKLQGLEGKLESDLLSLRTEL